MASGSRPLLRVNGDLQCVRYPANLFLQQHGVAAVFRQIPTVLQTGKVHGVQAFDDALIEHVQSGRIRAAGKTRCPGLPGQRPTTLPTQLWY